MRWRDNWGVEPLLVWYARRDRFYRMSPGRVRKWLRKKEQRRQWVTRRLSRGGPTCGSG